MGGGADGGARHGGGRGQSIPSSLSLSSLSECLSLSPSLIVSLSPPLFISVLDTEGTRLINPFLSLGGGGSGRLGGADGGARHGGGRGVCVCA